MARRARVRAAEWRDAYQGEPPVLPFGLPDPWRSPAVLAVIVDDLVERVMARARVP